MRDVCARPGLPDDTGGLARQFGSVVRRIVRLALPPTLPARLVPRRPAPVGTPGAPTTRTPDATRSAA